MPKIDRNGRVSYEADAAPPAEPEAMEAQEHPGTGEPMTGTEAPADGSWSETAGNDPVPGAPVPEQVTQLPAAESAVPEPVVPPRPPRRTPPGGAVAGA